MLDLQEVGDCLQKGVQGKEGGLSRAVPEGLSRAGVGKVCVATHWCVASIFKVCRQKFHQKPSTNSLSRDQADERTKQR